VRRGEDDGAAAGGRFGGGGAAGGLIGHRPLSLKRLSAEP
jgi:hypothetical protein